MSKLLKFIKENKWLLLIIALFLFSRLYKITLIPASVYWDEASIGYNAYSVLLTGKDEWGETLPLHFRAFGEFKLPVYVYSVAFFESFLGLNTLAVRLPAVIWGLSALIGLYFLALKLFKDKSLALLTSFIFCVSPWFFIFTRVGYEATAGVALFIWGIYFLINTFKKPWFLVVSTLLFILSFYSYNSLRILVPLVLVSVGIWWLVRNITKKTKWVWPFIFSVGILALSVIPIYRLYVSDAGLGRLVTVGVNEGNVIGTLGQNYLKHFSKEFLFTVGDENLRSHAPGAGQLYWLELPLIVLGLYNILKKRKLGYLLVLVGLILAPLPAAITKESPHALRSILMGVGFPLLATIGVELFREKKKLFRLVICLTGGIYLTFGVFYFHKYIVQYNKISSNYWQYPYYQIFEKYDQDFSQYDKVYITDDLAQPYIFALYYLKINPSDFIKTRLLSPVSDWGFSTVSGFSNFNFVKKCDVNPIPKSLVFCRESDFSKQGATKIDEIKDLNQNSVFGVYLYE